MNKVVFDVPPIARNFFAWLGESDRGWNWLIPRVESRISSQHGVSVTLPETSFYMNDAGQVLTAEQAKAKAPAGKNAPAGYQWIKRKYYNAELKKFVIWVRVN